MTAHDVTVLKARGSLTVKGSRNLLPLTLYPLPITLYRLPSTSYQLPVNPIYKRVCKRGLRGNACTKMRGKKSMVGGVRTPSVDTLVKALDQLRGWATWLGSAITKVCRFARSHASSDLILRGIVSDTCTQHCAQRTSGQRIGSHGNIGGIVVNIMRRKSIDFEITGGSARCL